MIPQISRLLPNEKKTLQERANDLSLKQKEEKRIQGDSRFKLSKRTSTQLEQFLLLSITANPRNTGLKPFFTFSMEPNGTRFFIDPFFPTRFSNA